MAVARRGASDILLGARLVFGHAFWFKA